MNRRLLIFFRQTAIAAVSTIVIWTIILMLFEEKFIFFPTRYPGGVYEDARFVPNLKDCWITTDDHVKIHAWFAPARHPTATFVISHGNAGNISHRLQILRRLQAIGFNVLMYDYRGYGRSEGTPNEAGIYKDGQAAFDYVLGLPAVDPRRVILWGTSLGGAVAVDVATHRTAAGIILESTFSSARDVARMVYPFLPIRFVLRTQLNSIDKISSLQIPVFCMHGDRDHIIPFQLGKKLYDAANDPKEFYTIRGADHNDTFWVGGDEYLEKVKSFASRILPLP